MGGMNEKRGEMSRSLVAWMMYSVGNVVWLIGLLGMVLVLLGHGDQFWILWKISIAGLLWTWAWGRVVLQGSNTKE